MLWSLKGSQRQCRPALRTPRPVVDCSSDHASSAAARRISGAACIAAFCTAENCGQRNTDNDYFGSTDYVCGR